jgi:hypothetical protein
MLLVGWIETIGPLSVIIVLLGTGFAYAPARSPLRRKLFENCGGILFITGLVLLGFMFPMPY